MTSRLTTTKITQYKEEGKRIVALTAYDYPTAVLLDNVGVDLILVGDSVGENILGYENSLLVTMQDMIHHTKAVTRGVKNAVVIGDMPFLSFQTGISDAIRNAGKFLQEACAQGVKIEGGKDRLYIINAVLEAGIPVLGHIGFKPQSLYRLGGYKVQGKIAEDAKLIYDDAKTLEQAGVFAIVIELVPDKVAKVISQNIRIPTIGIGSGANCDGQILVINDLIGLSDKKPKKHVKLYANLYENIRKAVDVYSQDIKNMKFPTKDQYFSIEDDEFTKFLSLIQ